MRKARTGSRKRAGLHHGSLVPASLCRGHDNTQLQYSPDAQPISNHEDLTNELSVIRLRKSVT
eukprot:6469714-Amphidinium_carterae.2